MPQNCSMRNQLNVIRIVLKITRNCAKLNKLNAAGSSAKEWYQLYEQRDD